MPHSINFGRYLQRLGFKRGDEPQFLHAVQPVQIVHDASALVPQEVGDFWLAGAATAPGAANVACLQIEAKDRDLTGEWFFSSNGTASQYTLQLLAAAPGPLLNSNTGQTFQLNGSRGRAATGSVFRAGGLLVPVGGALTLPAIHTGTAFNTVSIPFYCPAGFTLHLEQNVVNIAFRGFARYTEIEAHRAQ